MTFNNAKTVVYIPLPKFQRDRSRVDCCFFFFFHALVGYYRADGATHSTTVDLFVDSVIINKVVIGQYEIQ